MTITYKIVETDEELKINWWLVEYDINGKQDSFKTALDVEVTEEEAAEYFRRRAETNARLQS